VTRRCRALVLVSTLALAACGGPPPGPVEARSQADPGFVSAGDYELRYGTVGATDLPVEVADAYGVERRAGVLLLSVSVLRREEGRLPVPVEAKVNGTQRSLLGEPAALAFRELRAGGSPSWIAEIEPATAGMVVIDVVAEPVGSATRLVAQLRREPSSR
jgi:hypothetical protein